MKKQIKKIFNLPAVQAGLKNLEAFIWIAGLAILYFVHIGENNHFTICPLKNLGFDFCPGCGLGTSIHYLLHFDFVQSFHAHPLGIFAFIVLVHRILVLLHIPVLFQNKLSLLNKYNLKG
jgi:Protein of unknown function (DUF2752)